MRKSKYYMVSNEDFIKAITESTSIRETLVKLNMAAAGGAYKIFHKRVKELEIDTSHFTGQGHLKGKSNPWTPKIPLENILIENSSYINTVTLKNRIVRAGLLEYKCAECSILTWKDKELILHLDHINGINNDHRIENLRLLCPNCHSQTDTYCARNMKLKERNLIDISGETTNKNCIECGIKLKRKGTKLCGNCWRTCRHKYPESISNQYTKKPKRPEIQ